VPVESDLTDRVPTPESTRARLVEATNEITGDAPAPDRTAPQVQARRVRRVLRRIDPWSVLKVSFIFFICLYGVIIVSSLLVWRTAVSAGIIDNVEEFVVDLGFNDFQFAPEQMFRAVLFGGAGMILVATFMAVLATVLFNLISDLVGGVRLSMIEQQLLEDENA
jgi:hypothetical protein